MTLRKFQKLQLIWVALGLGYNALSFWRLNSGESALAPTDPLIGAVFMTICGLLILAGLKGAQVVYRIGIPILTALLAYSGLLVHLMAYAADPSIPHYASFAAWSTAILFNIYGVVTLVAGSWMAWQRGS